MLVRIRTSVFASALLLASLAASVSMGQAESQPGQATGQRQSGQRQPATMADAQLTACLLIDNRNEIAAAKIAQQPSEQQRRQAVRPGDHQGPFEIHRQA